jgi:hypothetical protein
MMANTDRIEGTSTKPEDIQDKEWKSELAKVVELYGDRVREQCQLSDLQLVREALKAVDRINESLQQEVAKRQVLELKIERLANKVRSWIVEESKHNSYWDVEGALKCMLGEMLDLGLSK